MQRNTWQREAVRTALSDAQGFVAAQTLFGRLKDQGSTIGLATVYRALNDLTASGDADAMQQDGSSLYRACTPGEHHHHLVCRVCGKTVEVEADGVEEWARAVAAEHGFVEPSHVVDVFGVCSDCHAARAATGPDGQREV
ncbi:Fur family transcriptional regulator [Curtobacterium sp. 9128]|uniref:Fur family transcriptional regulator n=1 Tax=Curtobacterium sp. 9128 TaxID=1793722 RepID=UPI00119D1C6B|nr:transcriptional repressor [Curtobacterium sp. 9128]